MASPQHRIFYLGGIWINVWWCIYRNRKATKTQKAKTTSFFKKLLFRQSWDGGRIGWGDHFLPHNFIERSFERWANSTKLLLNVGGGHQALRKAVHSLWEEVGQNIKDKWETKEVGTETCPRVGVVNENTRKPSDRWVCGEFWNLRGQHNWEEN